MSFGKTFTTRRRVAKAVWAFIINFVFWVVIPYYLGVLLAGRVSGSYLEIPSFVYEFGALFIVLEVGAAFFDGMAVSVPFLSGVAILSAVYLWYVTNGGALAVTSGSITFALWFRNLVYLFVLPSLWAAARAPLAYLIWRRELRSATLPPPPPPPA